MAASIKDLIDKKEALEAKKKELFDFETSIGTIIVKKPTKTIVAESADREEGNDAYIIVNQVVEPNLKDKELLKAFGCAEPLDIVDKLFEPGEVVSIAKAILKTAGYGTDIKFELHKELKN